MLDLRYPALYRRVMATLLDVLLVFAMWIIALPILDRLFGITGELTERVSDHLEIYPGNFGQLFPIYLGIWGAMALLATIFSYWLYAAIFESSSEQATIGKATLSMKVTDIKGHRISFSRAATRNLLKTISAPMLADCVTAIVASNNQAFHDTMVGCIVISKE